jgi:hypothetical protein
MRTFTECALHLSFNCFFTGVFKNSENHALIAFDAACTRGDLQIQMYVALPSPQFFEAFVKKLCLAPALLEIFRPGFNFSDTRACVFSHPYLYCFLGLMWF